MGAVGSTTTLVTLFTGLLIGMAGGVNVLVARFYGAKKEKDVQETTHTAVIICLLTGILIMVLGLLFANGILELLHTKDELIEGAALYLRIYFLGMPALAIYNFGNAVFSAVGNPNIRSGVQRESISLVIYKTISVTRTVVIHTAFITGTF